jgi:acetoin utilization protein AcuA
MMLENIDSKNDSAEIKADSIVFEGPNSMEYLENLGMDDGFSNFRVPEKQYQALLNIASSQDGSVYIANHNQKIVGYVLFHRPNQFSRWHRHPKILELGAIEISNKYRKMGLASKILKTAFSNQDMENYIVITTEFTWHWDLRDSKLDVWNYQRMLTKLFSSVNFKRRRTDDPEILEHPANMLMVRIGSKVPETFIKGFEEMLYQQSLVE